MAAAAPAATTKCGCTFDGCPWHDDLLRLEDDLSVVVRVVDQIQDLNPDFPEFEELRLFVSMHEWRDRRTVTLFAAYLADIDGLMRSLQEKLDAVGQ